MMVERLKKYRAFVRRFINEGPEKIAKQIIEVGAVDSAVLMRLTRKLSDREISKWENSPITNYEGWILSEHKEAAEVFELLAEKVIA